MIDLIIFLIRLRDGTLYLVKSEEATYIIVPTHTSAMCYIIDGMVFHRAMRSIIGFVP